MISILSLNVQGFNQSSKSKISKFINFIPDIVCTQEDLKFSDEWLKGYSRIAFCSAESTLDNNLCNAIYVKPNITIIDSQSYKFTYNNIVDRCFVYVVFSKNDITYSLVNLHLPGGRFDDKLFTTNIECKNNFINGIFNTVGYPDIILGDFNGENKFNERLESYLPYKIGKEIFLYFWSGGHSILEKNGYKAVPFNKPTSVYGVKSDWIYTKNIKIINYSVLDEYITKNLTDHAGIYCSCIKI